MTTIFLYDTNILNFNYEKFQKYYLTHLQSISDQIVSFTPELLELKKQLPKIDMLEFSGFNSKFWLHPIVNHLREEMQEFTSSLKQSLTQ